MGTKKLRARWSMEAAEDFSYDDWSEWIDKVSQPGYQLDERDEVILKAMLAGEDPTVNLMADDMRKAIDEEILKELLNHDFNSK